MTLPILCNLDIPQLVIASISLAVAIATLVFTILAFAVALTISKRQVRREEYSYLLFSIVTPYNSIETDAMLLSQGTIDPKFEKSTFDKEVLLAISKAKSYSLMIKNNNLFNYLDGLITGESEEQMGQFIEDYFPERKTFADYIKDKDLTDESVAKKAADFWEKFSVRARDLRDQTIKKIDSYLDK